MIKTFLLCLAVGFGLVAQADEGMWLPHLVGKQRYADMKAKGLKLTADQIYSINKNSLKDAVVSFGGFCTGEIVSNQGLIFTNHHCGYGAITNASTVAHNYLRDGFFAKSKAEEISADGLFVDFLIRIDDVTKQVQDSMKGANFAEWDAKRSRVLANVAKQLVTDSLYHGRVYSMFRDNQFLLYTFQRFRDIRLVGTSPEAVGKFGGDTDNWEWPRHTGDFSVFRVYMSPDGKPAAFSPNNIPLKPKHFLPISLKPIKEGDFTMVLGYPGSTNRFETSYGIKLATDLKNPAFVRMRDIRLKAWHEQMVKDPATKLQLADVYASLANYWKFYDGETKQLLKYDVFGTKQKQEATLENWIRTNNKQEFAGLFSNYQKAYSEWMPYAVHKEYYEQGITGPYSIRLANIFEKLETSLVNGAAITEAQKTALQNMRAELLKRIQMAAEQKMLGQLVYRFNQDIDPDQQPTAFYNSIKQTFGPLGEEETYKKWAAFVFANSFLLNNTEWEKFLATPDVVKLQNDPLYSTAKAFKQNWQKIAPQSASFNAAIAQLSHLYQKAFLEANKAKTFYPDANSSMRVSYGQVRNYKPRDGVLYDYVTTSKGLLEKYKAGDLEFDLPANQVALLKAKDFGPYADPVRKDLIVNFISTDDITGGNSGSPVINGSGHLIGLAFDGNYEALSHKINFDKDLCRTICVSTNYVLWCIDKLGGAKNIISELQIVK